MIENIEYAVTAQPLGADTYHDHAQHAHAQHAHAQPAERSRGRRIAGFAWHFVQMALAMTIGMVIFGALLGMVLRPMGLGAAFARGTLLNNLGMGAAMTVPMVVWMLRRGHGWRLTIEMTAAMLAPMAAAYLLDALGADAAGRSLLRFSHPGMYLAMLAAMLVRYKHYAH